MRWGEAEGGLSRILVCLAGRLQFEDVLASSNEGAEVVNRNMYRCGVVVAINSCKVMVRKLVGKLGLVLRHVWTSSATEMEIQPRDTSLGQCKKTESSRPSSSLTHNFAFIDTALCIRQLLSHQVIVHALPESAPQLLQ